MSKKIPTSRVDKLLGSMGYGSRAEMARLGKAGGIVLDGADLRGADFTGAYLENASFKDAQLQAVVGLEDPRARRIQLI